MNLYVYIYCEYDMNVIIELDFFKIYKRKYILVINFYFEY